MTGHMVWIYLTHGTVQFTKANENFKFQESWYFFWVVESDMKSQAYGGA